MRVCSVLILCLIFSLDHHKSPDGFNELQETENFDWMLGDWTRVNDKKGITTTEKWEKTSGNIYIGTGLAAKNGETVFKENLRLLKKDGYWVYEVTGVNPDTTNFVLTSISEDSFSAVNPENPFPKEISYRLENGQMIAEISGDAKKIVFNFEKKVQK